MASMPYMGRNLGKGVVAGIVGGLVGSVALRAWMTGASYAHRHTVLPDQNGPAHQVGVLALKTLTGAPASEEQRAFAGETMHYGFGAFTGALYGAMAEYMPWVTAGHGMLFGTGVFVAADETSMPLLGLVPPPWTESTAAQVEHLAAHLIYGIVSDWTRRGARRLLR